MKTTIALVLAGLGFGSALLPAGAQEAPRPNGPPPMGAPGPGPMHEGMREGPGWRMGRFMHRMREFALIYPAPDRNLSGADVQKIAEAFLLFNGNHSWKVTEVTEEPNRVTFALATPDGTAIAHFAMDRHTARPERLN